VVHLSGEDRRRRQCLEPRACHGLLGPLRGTQRSSSEFSSGAIRGNQSSSGAQSPARARRRPK
jgi:hypothetical protein